MHNKKIYDIFKLLNGLSRPSHHEEKVAAFLCKFASDHGLSYDRDAENCVVIRKPATPGYEDHETIVLLNHMDMVAVSDGSHAFVPEHYGIEAYTRKGWMKAHGTSLGADNGIGLSMALAVLDSDDIPHGPLEVLTTTNEEDGMTGAANLSPDFIKGRKVINLDSEDYDTITVGAAGAYLQVATFNLRSINVEEEKDNYTFICVDISNGLSGHSGVDINKGRCNTIFELCSCLQEYKETSGHSFLFVFIFGGDANASIPRWCGVQVGIPNEFKDEFIQFLKKAKKRLKAKYSKTDPKITLSYEVVPHPTCYYEDDRIIETIAHLPNGVIRMRDDMPDTVMTSNNIGMVRSLGNITISCHTRSFSNKEMVKVGDNIFDLFSKNGASIEIMMNTPAWQENSDSDYISLVSQTFQDKLGFIPRKVAMHFVLEAGYFVQKYPGIEIACIGPRIIDPHSPKERVEIETIDNIWDVLVELLRRL